MITIFHGTVKSGKSEELIRVINNYKYMNPPENILVLKPNIDTREGRVREIFSRNGGKTPCLPLYNMQEFKYLIHLHQPSTIFIDEVQFLDKSVVEHIVKTANTIDYYLSGLRTDFKGEVFQSMATLMSHADLIDEVRAMCACKNNAIYNLKVNSEGTAVDKKGNSIEIGDHYKPVCRNCFFNSKIKDTK